MNYQFTHFNFNVLSIEKSIAFYQEILGLHVVKEMKGDDGSFRIVYLEDSQGGFQLELTEMMGRGEPYDLGELEFHLAFVSDDYEESRKKHAQANLICFDNEAMGIYFIEDPDGYWIEILPNK